MFRDYFHPEKKECEICGDWQEDCACFLREDWKKLCEEHVKLRLVSMVIANSWFTKSEVYEEDLDELLEILLD